MSTRNPYSWTVIHDTVRAAQDLLISLWRGRLKQDRLALNQEIEDLFATTKPVGPPQTLGELCLGLASDARLKGGTVALGWARVGREYTGDLRLFVNDKDILGLRRAMYHRPGK